MTFFDTKKVFLAVYTSRKTEIYDVFLEFYRKNKLVEFFSSGDFLVLTAVTIAQKNLDGVPES